MKGTEEKRDGGRAGERQITDGDGFGIISVHHTLIYKTNPSLQALLLAMFQNDTFIITITIAIPKSADENTSLL